MTNNMKSSLGNLVPVDPDSVQLWSSFKFQAAENYCSIESDGDIVLEGRLLNDDGCWRIQWYMSSKLVV